MLHHFPCNSPNHEKEILKHDQNKKVSPVVIKKGTAQMGCSLYSLRINSLRFGRRWDWHPFLPGE